MTVMPTISDLLHAGTPGTVLSDARASGPPPRGGQCRAMRRTRSSGSRTHPQEWRRPRHCAAAVPCRRSASRAQRSDRSHGESGAASSSSTASWSRGSVRVADPASPTSRELQLTIDCTTKEYHHVAARRNRSCSTCARASRQRTAGSRSPPRGRPSGPPARRAHSVRGQGGSAAGITGSGEPDVRRASPQRRGGTPDGCSSPSLLSGACATTVAQTPSANPGSRRSHSARKGAVLPSWHSTPMTPSVTRWISR